MKKHMGKLGRVTMNLSLIHISLYQKDHPNFKLNIEENVYSDIETKLITAATSEDYSTLPDLSLIHISWPSRACTGPRAAR